MKGKRCRRRLLKRLLSGFLAFILFFMLMPCPDNSIGTVHAASGVEIRLNELRSQYPNGKYWHRVNGVNAVTSIRCIHPDNTWRTWNENETNGCGRNYLGWQCVAFASQIFLDIFGETIPDYGGTRTDVQNIMVGDYARTYAGHSFIVAARNGNTLTAVECNWRDTCMIDWTNTHDISEVAKFYHASNYDEVNNYNPIPQGSPIPDAPRTISDGDYHIVSAAGGGSLSSPGQYCLTIGGLPGTKDNPEENALLWSAFGWKDHVFTVKYHETGYNTGYYTIKLKDSVNQYLDVAGGALARGTNVQQYTGNGSIAQQWIIKETDGGAFTIQSKCNGWYVDVEGGTASNGTNIRLWEENGSIAEKWYFVPWGGGSSAVQRVPDGEYQIVPKLDNNKTLSAAGNGTTDGTNIQLSSCLGDEKHTFDITWLGNGYYKITNKNSGLALDNAGGDGNVHLWSPHNGYNQQWLIKSGGGGYYNIISRCNGLYLDLYGGSTNDGTNVSMCVGWGENGADNQKWTFIPYKVEPEIIKNPSALEITYGQTLSASTLSGGITRPYGSFAWQDGTIKPTCADSETTQYKVVFTPENAAFVPCIIEIPIKVNPAQNPPDMPETSMTAAADKQTVGDIQLPDGWIWQEADADKTLDTYNEVTATAVYSGSDKGNYVNESLEISITKSADAGTVLNIAGIGAENSVYNGNSHKGYTGTPAASGYSGGFNISYSGRNGTDYDSAAAPVNAGDYTVSVSPRDSAYTGTVSLNFTIAKADITISADDKTAKTGDTAPQPTYTVTGLAGGDSLKKSPTVSYETAPNMAQAGTVAIKAGGAEVPDNGNYNETITYKDGTLTITKSDSGEGGNEGGDTGEEHTHAYSDTWKSSETEHWKECSECGSKTEISAHDFTWEAEGEHSRHEVCSVCGYIGRTEDISDEGDDKPGEGDDNPSEGDDNLNEGDNKPGEGSDTSNEGGDNPNESSAAPSEYAASHDDNSESSDDDSTAYEPWQPSTPDEWKRYNCMGKEALEYTLAEANPYALVIENAMQGALCFDSFEAVLDDYVIGRTYNIYQYPDKTYSIHHYLDNAYSMNQEVQFTIKIPEAIYDPNRKYKMICVTESGLPIIYDDLDMNPETITIRTNRFYAYALIYK